MAKDVFAKKPKVLLLSAYDTASHRHWHEGLVKYLNHYNWTVLTLPPRNFNWRIRSNAISWLVQNKNELNQNYEAIVATSMVDLASLKGIVPALAHTPTLLYFHENQFAYPVTAGIAESVEPKITQLYSALSANKLVFNTRFNQRSFTKGLEAFLRQMPDKLPVQLASELAEKSCVLPVPLLLPSSPLDSAFGTTKEKYSIVWNHRWEHDKGPELLLHFLRLCDTCKLPIKLYLLGERFRKIPPAMQVILHKFNHYIACSDFIADKNTYYQTLARCEVVASTAHHEFQGLSILEATALGCLPLVPDHLAYAEHFPKWGYAYDQDHDKTAHAMMDKLLQLRALSPATDTENKTKLIQLKQTAAQFSWIEQTPHYKQAIDALFEESSNAI